MRDRHHDGHERGGARKRGADTPARRDARHGSDGRRPQRRVEAPERRVAPVREKLFEADLEARKSVWDPFVDPVLATLDANDREVRLSSHEAAIAAERSTYPVAPTLWDSVEDRLAIAERHDAAAVHLPAEVVRRTLFSTTRGSAAPPSNRKTGTSQ